MAANFNFRKLWAKLVPRWLSDGDGGLIGYTLALLHDASAERLRLGHLARFPQQGPDGTPGPPDALAALGRDRGVVRGIDETDRSYAYRLTQWLVDARTRGTAFTLMKTLAAYVDWDGSKGASFRVVDNRGNWFSRAADGTQTSSLNTGNWDWDGDTSKWGRFWVIVYPATRWVDTGEDWGDDVWAGSTWGSTSISEVETRTIQALVAEWSPLHARCETIVLALDAASFDPTTPEPDGSWATWSNRLTTARYLDGT